MANIIYIKQEKYQYLSSDGQCSQESFYECLSRLLASRLEQSKCSIISYPNLPICKTNETKSVSRMAMYYLNHEVLSFNSTFKNELCPKLCTTVDYNGELGVSQQMNLWAYDYKTSATFAFEYRFKQSSVIVYKEYVIYDAISMIGSVGGTLGMCIGFSFTGLVSYIINLLHHIFLKIEIKSAIPKSNLQKYTQNEQKSNCTTFEENQFNQRQNIDKYNQLKMEMNDKFKEQANVLQRIAIKLGDIESKLS